MGRHGLGDHDATAFSGDDFVDGALAKAVCEFGSDAIHQQGIDHMVEKTVDLDDLTVD